MSPHWTIHPVTTTLLLAPCRSGADGETQKPHSVLAQSPRRLPLVSCCRENGSPVLPSGLTLRKFWYRTALHTPIFLMSVPNIFHGWNQNAQLRRSHSIDDAMRLVQVNYLVMFGYVCPSHFRNGLQIVICAANVVSDTLETWFPDSQHVSLFRVTRPKRSVTGYQF